MKKYLTLFLFVLVTTFAFGQSNYQEVVYLKNGSITRGVIIEQIPNKSIKIETADKNVFVYKMDEIAKLTKEPLPGNSDSSFHSSGLKPGYKGIVELGYQVGTGDYGMDRLKLNIVSSYQINPNFSLGLGTGLRFYFDESAAVVPVFVDFRTNLINKGISPYFLLDVGYSFDATEGLEGLGFMLNPAIGVSFKVSDNNAMNIGLSYEMQKMDFYYSGYHNYYTSSENSGAISIDVGISF